MEIIPDLGEFGQRKIHKGLQSDEGDEEVGIVSQIQAPHWVVETTSFV